MYFMVVWKKGDLSIIGKATKKNYIESLLSMVE